MRQILLGYGMFTLIYVVVVTLIYLLILLVSFKGIKAAAIGFRYARFKSMSGSEFVPPISILVPAHNEGLTIIQSVRSLLGLNYPSYEVIVINDGSGDDTLDVLIQAFNLHKLPNRVIRKQVPSPEIKSVYHNPDIPKLYVVDKDNSGKGTSLNVGINLSRYPLICSVDADSLLEKDALIRIARVYMENPDETVTVGGNVRIANGCTVNHGKITSVRLPKNAFALAQTIEYIKAFLGGRIGWSALNGLIIVSGAFGVFRKDYVIKVGGYFKGPGEDMNLILKLHKFMADHKLRYRVAFCSDAVCWTQGPDSYRILRNQRRRWGRSNIVNLLSFRKMFLNPKYKTMGLLTIPYNVLYEVLNPYVKVLGLIALIAYDILGMTTPKLVLEFLAVNFLMDYLISLGSILLEEMVFHRYPRIADLLKMLTFSFYMTFWYYHLSDFWRICGHIEYLRKKESWGVMKRQSWASDTQ